MLFRSRQRQAKPAPTDSLNADTPSTEWEAALAAAEDYWFHLPETTRTQYTGRVVALLGDQILGADTELKVLRRTIAAQYPNQPVLYLDADTEQESPLFISSPQLR